MLLRALLRRALVVCMTAVATHAQPNASTLQAALTHAMAQRQGAAVVLDVRTGRVLAAHHLAAAARRPAYPGSSIKPFTLMALLEAGKVDRQTALVCKRSVRIAGRKLDCTHPVTKQPLDPAAALAYSCNSYFSTVALRLTPAQLRDAFVHDGFASLTSQAPNEAAGQVALAQSPEQEQLEAIGEWGVKITPLELAQAYRGLALLQSRHYPRMAPLFEGLNGSVEYGMARMAQPDIPMKVAGKTGTAPAEEGSWTHGWFAGYAPAENPEIVVVVFLEKGRGGSDAAVVARSIFGAFAQSRSAERAVAKAGGRN